MMAFLWNTFAVIGILTTIVMLVAGYVIWETRK
jgi:hypothetical protein